MENSLKETLIGLWFSPEIFPFVGEAQLLGCSE